MAEPKSKNLIDWVTNKVLGKGKKKSVQILNPNMKKLLSQVDKG